jgi:c-di-GMP-binding flagellar brake protein YcgR
MAVGLIAAAVAVVLLVAFGALLRRAGGGRFPWLQFFLKGRESGFRFREINLLRRMAVENRIKNPTSLFWSVRLLDRSIRSVILRYRSLSQEDDPEAVGFVSKLFDFRRRVEFNQPKYTLGLKSTREVTNRQRFSIQLPELGPFSAIVVDNLRRYMAISYPQGPKIPPGFSWKNQQISVNFWRDGDAGYYFQTKVLEDYSSREYPILHISHTDAVVRTQKRRSVRAPADLPAHLFPLRSIEEGGEDWETTNGLRCRLVDISEDGAALMIGGKAKVGLPIKFQFVLDDHRLVMSGVVRGSTFDEKKNRSILHVQAGSLSLKAKNTIRAYVYNIFGQKPEPTPVRAEAARPAAIKAETAAREPEGDAGAAGPVG